MEKTGRSKSRLLALNACNACKQRKTKCDESKPQCSRCCRLGLTCTYADTLASRRDLSITELNGTLQRIESKLDSLIERPGDHVDSTRADQTSNPQTPREPLSTPSQNWTSKRHATAPQHLLSWPCSPLQLSRADLQYPVKLEIYRPKPLETVEPPSCLAHNPGGPAWLSGISIAQLRLLAEAYFSHFHPSYMILDESHFYRFNLARTLQDDFAPSVDACLVLLVLGLGAVAAYHKGDAEWAPNTHDSSPAVEVGLGFLSMAKEMFRQTGGINWPSVQCSLLMSSFYSCKLRVFDSWSATHKACTTVLLLLPLETALDAQHCQLYWIAYMQESQILAEFDFPPSGLADYASDVPLPVVPDSGAGPHHREYQFSLLAVITLRRLLNRIHSHLYSGNSSQRVTPSDGIGDETSPAGTGEISIANTTSPRPECVQPPLGSLITELDRQLEEWRACLPPPLHFPAYELGSTEAWNTPDRQTSSDRLKNNLIARYCAAKSILYRPYLYYALHARDVSQLPHQDMRAARVAVDAAFQSFLYNGMTREPLSIHVHPVNAWRSLFALELQIKFITLATEPLQSALPVGSDVVSDTRERIAQTACVMSRCLARDVEILRML